MYKLSTALLALANLAWSNPVPNGGTSNPNTYGLPQIARFENDPGATPLVAANPVDLYLDIFWQGWEVFTFGAAGDPTNLPGVIPQSPDNLISFGTLDAATIDQGTPELTVVYPDTTIDHFSFYSFFFGCVVSSTETAAGVPQTCTVTVTGFDKNNKQVAKQSFTFTSNGGLNQQMVQARLVGFDNLQRAEFSTKASLLGLPTTAAISTLGDTFNYTVFSASPISP
ncbi:hypothetical protein ACLMJK_002553 [Lecanora helva]